MDHRFDDSVDPDVVATMAAIWKEVFGALPSSTQTLIAMAHNRDEDQLREYLVELKKSMMALDSQGTPISSENCSLLWKSEGDLNALQTSHGLVIPSLPIVIEDTIDREISSIAGVETDSFRLIAARRLPSQIPGAFTDEVLNHRAFTKSEDGNNEKDLHRAVFLSLVAKAIVSAHNKIMDGENLFSSDVIPISENSKGPLFVHEKEARLLGLLAVPAFVTEISDRTRTAAPIATPFELVVLPISKGTLIAFNAYDRGICVAAANIARDPQIVSDSPANRFEKLYPIVLKEGAFLEAEDFEECNILPELMNGKLPVTWRPYLYRSGCLEPMPDGELRGYVPPYLMWGGNCRRKNDGTLFGPCASCGEEKPLQLCPLCEREGCCSDTCSSARKHTHAPLCDAEVKARVFWRKLHQKRSRHVDGDGNESHVNGAYKTQGAAPVQPNVQPEPKVESLQKKEVEEHTHDHKCCQTVEALESPPNADVVGMPGIAIPAFPVVRME